MKSCKIQTNDSLEAHINLGKKSANNLQVSKSSRDPPRDDPPPSLELEWAGKGVPRDGWEHYPLIETSYVYNSSGIKETFTAFLSTLANTHGIRFAQISYEVVEVRPGVTFMKGTFRTLIRLKYTNGYISMNLIAYGDVLVFSVTIVIRNMVFRLVENVEIS